MLALRLSRGAAALVLAFALAVGFQPLSSPALPAYCEEVYGACVLFDADFPPDARSYVLSRVREGARRAATYWDAPLELTGWTLVYHGYWPLPDGLNLAWGYTIPELRRVDMTLKAPLCPETVLVHELGHVFSVAAGGDGRPHGPGEDPRFDHWSIVSALAGMPRCEP